ncbi:TerB family tellurite resistance protein, partial [Mesorhizobium sp. M2A.F.Ca.ET.039.01.1.1]
ILADGSVSESEMVVLRRICREAFGIPEASIDSVIEYLNDYGYETNGSQAIALFRDLDVERRKLLARHMAEIAKADSKLAESEVKLLRRTLDLLDISPVDLVKREE